MTVSECQTAIKTLLLTDTTYLKPTIDGTPKECVTIGSYQILDDGVDYAAVILPGKVEDGDPMNFTSEAHWHILIDIFCKYKADAATNWTNFTSFRDTFITKLLSYPTLNNVTGVHNVKVMSDEDPGAVFKGKAKETGPVFIIQRMRVVVSQMVVLNTGEYA